MTKPQRIQNDIKKEIERFFIDKGIDSPNIYLEKSDIATHGDISINAALRYGNILKQNPLILAQEIASCLQSKHIDYISDIQAIKPGFVNIFFNTHFFTDILRNILRLKKTFGKNNTQKDKTWVIEHTSPNPNKAMHLGHLRNNLVGMSIARILEWNGAKVICDAVNNNRGIAIVKMMWGFLAHMKKNNDTPSNIKRWITHPHDWYTPEEADLLYDLFINKCYILGEKDFRDNPAIEKLIRKMVVQWEAHDKNVWKLWRHVLYYADMGIDRTLTRLNNRWDKVWAEHQHYTAGKKYIQKGLALGIFKKLNDGAILTNLAAYNLSDTILLKNDGTSLYITQDIALTALKKKTYRADRLVWVIGPDQSLAMQQLFAICEQLGIGSLKDFIHVAYGYVGLKDNGKFQKMSSRGGATILIDDVINATKDEITNRFAQNDKNDNTDIKSRAEKLALAAVKFNILKSDRNQDMLFDIHKSIEISGDSGIYVMYAYARAQSVLRKAKQNNFTIAPQSTVSTGQDITRLLITFPQVVQESSQSLSAHHIAQFLLELCGLFNAWYAQETILDNSNTQSHKLAITKATSQTIANGLELLGISTVEKI